jgi:GNAT superfamily N-acetyltransferase
LEIRVEQFSELYYDDIIKIVENFHEESLGEYDQLFDKEALYLTIQNAQHNNAFLLIINNRCEGILYGQEISSKFNDKRLFQEILWYVNEPYRKYGVRLLREVEKRLKTDGFSIMIMSAMENSKSMKLKVFYERLGFKAMETNYMRTL